MKKPNKETRIQMLEARLSQYELKHEDLHHDILAAEATGELDVDEVISHLRRQQESLSRAHDAISAELERVQLEEDSGD